MASFSNVGGAGAGTVSSEGPSTSIVSQKYDPFLLQEIREDLRRALYRLSEAFLREKKLFGDKKKAEILERTARLIGPDEDSSPSLPAFRLIQSALEDSQKGGWRVDSQKTRIIETVLQVIKAEEYSPELKEDPALLREVYARSVEAFLQKIPGSSKIPHTQVWYDDKAKAKLRSLHGDAFAEYMLKKVCFKYEDKIDGFTALDLSRTDLGKRSGDDVVALFSRIPKTITSLNISSNDFYDLHNEGGRSLERALQASPQIDTLVLGSNIGLNAMLRMIRGLPGMTIGPGGIMGLLRDLPANIKTLDIDLDELLVEGVTPRLVFESIPETVIHLRFSYGDTRIGSFEWHDRVKPWKISRIEDRLKSSGKEIPSDLEAQVDLSLDDLQKTCEAEQNRRIAKFVLSDPGCSPKKRFEILESLRDISKRSVHYADVASYLWEHCYMLSQNSSTTVASSFVFSPTMTASASSQNQSLLDESINYAIAAKETEKLLKLMLSGADVVLDDGIKSTMDEPIFKRVLAYAKSEIGERTFAVGTTIPVSMAGLEAFEAAAGASASGGVEESKP